MKIILVWKLFALAILLGSLVPCIAQAGLIAEWRFEEGIPDAPASGALSVLDTSGNSLHGTPIDGPIYRLVPDGGQGLEFNGVSTRVTVADDPKFQLTKSLTLEANIRVDALPDTIQLIVARMDDRAGLDAYFMGLTADGHLRFGYDNESGQRTQLIAPDPIPVGVFVHVASTLDDATGDVRLFVDRQLVALTEGAEWRPLGELDPNHRPGIGIGSWSYEANRVFNGMIDELRVWDEARSVPEPSTAILWLVAGFSGLSIIRWRRCSVV